MPDSNTTKLLIDNSDIIFPYFLIVITALVVILFLFRESIFKKYAKEYFNEEISKELSNYKKEFFTLLKDRKIANTFKEKPILILNDEKKLIQEVAYMSNYVHQVLANIDDESKNLHDYNFVLLYLLPKSSKFNPEDLYARYVEKFLSKLDKDETILYIYYEGYLEKQQKDKIPKHHVFINSKLTLVERLENAYFIKRVIEL